MTAKLADRVKETSTSTGTGTINLDGAVSGFQTFVAGIGSGNSCYYAIVHQSAAEWEVGVGTVTDASPDTLSRTTILASSNSGSAVSFSAGTKDVFCTLAAAYPPLVGGMTLIASSTLGSDTASFSFTNIPATYKDLRLVVQGRGDGTTSHSLLVRFNNDSGANYYYRRIMSDGASVTTDQGTQDDKIYLVPIASTTQNADAVTDMTMEIINYAGTTFHKTFKAHAATLGAASGNGEGQVIVGGGRWASASAINRVDVLMSGTGKYKTGSYAALYGLGG